MRNVIPTVMSPTDTCIFAEPMVHDCAAPSHLSHGPTWKKKTPKKLPQSAITEGEPSVDDHSARDYTGQKLSTALTTDVGYPRHETSPTIFRFTEPTDLT